MKNADLLTKLEFEESNIPPEERNYSPKYAYLFSKCCLYYYNGANKYKDYFGYPKKCWSRTAIKAFANQVANGMKGISAQKPILIPSLFDMFQCLKMFHFEVEDIQFVGTLKRLEVQASHIVDKEPLVLYFELV